MGSYGIVFRVIDEETQKVYACKQMSMKELKAKSCLDDLQNEIANLR